MELSQLRYFCALAKYGTLTAAAEKLHITPAALSLSLSHLEADIGAPLFDRVKGRLVLNSSGRLFLQSSKDGLAEIDKGVRALRSLCRTADNLVSVVATDEELWRDIITGFLRQNPALHLRFNRASLSRIKSNDMLIQYDFVLAPAGRIKGENTVAETLFFSSDMMVVVPQGHRLWGAGSVDIHELAHERFIFPLRGYMSDYCHGLCADAGFEPNIIAECSYLTRSHLVRQGLGISFTARKIGNDHLYQGCDLLSLRGVSMATDLSQQLLWDKRRQINPAAKAFHDYILGCFSDQN